MEMFGEALFFEFVLYNIMTKINHRLTVTKFQCVASEWRYPVGIFSMSMHAAHYALWSQRLRL